MTSFKSFLRTIYRLLNSFGFNVSKILSIPSTILSTFSSLVVFLQKGGRIHSLWPIFNEDFGESSSISDYMILDYLVASDVLSRGVSHHFDIGSRVDGLILQLSHTVKVTVLDVRPSPKLNNFGVTSLVGNASSIESLSDSGISSFQSVSCLHAIEHFGLGRYGDDIDPHGPLKFLDSISKSLASNTVFYLGFPVGNNQVFFNAHRLMHPLYYYQSLKEHFELVKAYVISPKIPSLWVKASPPSEIFQLDDRFLQDSSCAVLLCLRKI